MRKTFFFLLLCYCQLSFSQDYNWWINGQAFSGIILPYDGNRHLIKGCPSGFDLNLQKELNGHQAWEKKYNLPIINYGLSYYDLKNDRQLGKLFMSSISIDIPLLKESRNRPYFRLGTGLIYSTQAYDKVVNNQNILIGSPISYLLQFGLNYPVHLTNQIKITPSIHFTHASNGAQAIPNRGLNMATLNLGITYKIIDKNSEKDIPKQEEALIEKHNYKYYFLFSSGKNILSYQAQKAEFFFNGSFIIQKHISQRSDLQIGLEYFHSNALKTAIKTSWFNKDLTDFPDFRRVALMAGHEFKAGKIGLITQLGVYIYQPNKTNRAVYQRYGLKYEFTRHIIGQFAVKAHGYASEEIEFSIGWSI